MKAIVCSLAVVSTMGATVNPHATFELHRELIKENSIQPLSEPIRLGKAASAGSYMTQIFESANCAANSLYTASGYVYNRCITVEGNLKFNYYYTLQFIFTKNRKN